MRLIKQAEWNSARVEARVDELISQGFAYGEREAHVAMCKWISDRGQEHWLWIVLNYNWGNGPLPLQFMIETYECDFAVAKSIFWFSEFDYYWCDDNLWKKHANDPILKCLIYIIEREEKSGFPRSRLRRLEWAGSATDKAIAKSVRSQACQSAPPIPECLVDTSDLGRVTTRNSFKRLKIGDIDDFGRLGAF
ncbi:MAG: DUF4274 domain-containing protein [Novosphingobium sp.]|nr:DUF4274 domain-containing protein [Novosphingobium sp.]